MASSNFSLPANLPMEMALAPAADAAGRTGRYTSLKHALRAWVVFLINQGNAATIACSISKATTIAGAGATAVTESLRIWSNLDVATAGGLTARTAAASLTTDAATTQKVVVFEIDPGSLGETFDCIAPVTGASNVANITAAFVVVQHQYPQATPPSVRLD